MASLDCKDAGTGNLLLSLRGFSAFLQEVSSSQQVPVHTATLDFTLIID